MLTDAADTVSAERRLGLLLLPLRELWKKEENGDTRVQVARSQPLLRTVTASATRTVTASVAYGHSLYHMRERRRARASSP